MVTVLMVQGLLTDLNSSKAASFRCLGGGPVAGQIASLSLPESVALHDAGQRQPAARSCEAVSSYGSPAATYAFSEQGRAAVHQAGGSSKDLLLTALLAQTTFTIEWDSRQLAEGMAALLCICLLRMLSTSLYCGQENNHKL